MGLLRDDCGQATLEAAFLLPMVFVFILISLQPAILLYNDMVMHSAATEACRLLRTRPSGIGDKPYLAYIERRLASVPPVDLFHAHEPCSWDVSISGGESSSQVTVTIQNSSRPIPLFGPLWARGDLDSNGLIRRSVSAAAPGMPSWVDGSRPSPSDWVTR